MQLPSAIAALVGNCEVEPVDIGESGVSVFRIARSGGRTVFLKCGPLGSELRAEAERLRWLSGRVPVPDVLVYLSEAGREYLLIDGLSGLNGIDAGRRDPLSVAAALGRALKHFHVQPARDCPFDQTIDVQMRRARWRTENGRVDEADFDQERLGRSAFELLAELEASRPAIEERVVTHGDACLPNVIFESGRVTGFVDCGRAGIADPYQDLALASRSIEWNLGVGCADMFFRQYGVSNPDPAKLDFYRLLDEFF